MSAGTEGGRQQRAMQELHNEVVVLCERAKKVAREFGLASMSRVSLLLRDPANDRMHVLVTNEPEDAAVAEAFRVALDPANRAPQEAPHA